MAMYPAFRAFCVMLGSAAEAGKIAHTCMFGCEVAEFLMAAQVYLAGLGHKYIWSPMKRPGYWMNMTQYNAWVDHTNPVIAESCK